MVNVGPFLLHKLHEERESLEWEIEKLSAFLESEDAGDVCHTEIARLQAQRSHMIAYCGILSDRIRFHERAEELNHEY